MVFLGYLSLAMAFTMAAAKPIALNDVNLTPINSTKGHFTVTQQLNPGFKKNGTLALAKAYAKYGKKLELHVEDSGSVTATPTQYDSEYLCPVTLGEQTLNLDFDSGSADLWVFSNKLSASERSGHTTYNPSSSSTFKTLSGYSWEISYGDGSGASGTVGTETVNIGGVTVTSQAVEVATSVSSEFTQDTDTDGLVGLAFSSINTVQPKSQKTFFDNAMDNLDQPVFTADLRHDEAGSYDFGVINDSKYTGDIEYVDVDSSQGFWEFTASGYAIGTGSTKSTSIDGIADTGTTLLLLDDSIVSAYYKKVSGAENDSSQGGYVFSCDATLPDFSFKVGSHTATISGDLMNYAPIDDSGSSCFGALQSNSGIGFSIFGDIMFKSQFVVFDGANVQLGFADKA